MEQGHSILNTGSELGRFRLLKKVAVGGMAEVWSAEERQGDRRRTLALKVLQPTFAGDPSFRAMFQDEVDIATLLDHPNIVKVYGAHEVEGQLFQSMELLDGLDLRRMLSQLIRAGARVPVMAALHIAEQIALALAYAHQKKNAEGKPLEIVHRDVSPHNVMLTRSAQVKLLDFGIARAAERLARTHTGIVKGKIAYMAPEQALAVGVTPQTDIFAAGVVLWEMLAMQRLFRADNDADAMALVVAARVPKIDEKNREVPPEATALLHRMLEHRAVNRPASMAEVAVGLRKILDKKGNAFDFASWVTELFEGPRAKVVEPPTEALASDTGPIAVADVTEPVPAPAFADPSGEVKAETSTGESAVVDPSGRTVALTAINTHALKSAEPTPYPPASISGEAAPTIALQAPVLPASASVSDSVPSASSPSNSLPLVASPSSPTPSDTPSSSTPSGATPSEGSRAAGFRLPTRSEIRRAIEDQPTMPVVADPRFLAMMAHGTGAKAPLPKVERIDVTRTDEGAMVAPSIQLEAQRSDEAPRQSEIETDDLPLRSQPLSGLAGSSPDALPPVPLSISAPPTERPAPNATQNTNLEVTLIRVSAGLAMIAMALLVLFLLKAC